MSTALNNYNSVSI